MRHLGGRRRRKAPISNTAKGVLFGISLVLALTTYTHACDEQGEGVSHVER